MRIHSRRTRTHECQALCRWNKTPSKKINTRLRAAAHSLSTCRDFGYASERICLSRMDDHEQQSVEGLAGRRPTTVRHDQSSWKTMLQHYAIGSIFRASTTIVAISALSFSHPHDFIKDSITIWEFSNGFSAELEFSMAFYLFYRRAPEGRWLLLKNQIFF